MENITTTTEKLEKLSSFNERIILLQEYLKQERGWTFFHRANYSFISAKEIEDDVNHSCGIDDEIYWESMSRVFEG